ncbi:LysR family transcriptional regulator [Vibrio sp. OCN044]|uniref:LysR family transcriptional regulator n=1 Tax=Vibrio tetraodonis subsp. pristinus TaxID=2695891 RepID=A0A6L8LTQ6_9VIBR|nr:LysR family transcriptional regulator [Vibrio tetraodonis]MYM59105.1 LysR family transcriptional regulator [Vibrio tetraodonis subsp. pristinus]
MDFDKLHTFCQLAQDGNYRIASEHLCITQSALTKKIQRLEAQIGISLFDRGRQGAYLTQAGQTLLPEAQRLVASFKAFGALADMVVEGTTGTLNIGFGISSYHLAPNYIARFKRHFPNIHITLNDLPSHSQNIALLRDELQLSFSRLPVDPPLTAIRLISDSLVVAFHRSVCVDKSNLWQCLKRKNYLRLRSARGRGLSRQIDMLLAEHGQKLYPVQEADDIQTLLALVSADLGFTIIPKSASYIANSNIIFFSLEGEQSVWESGLVWNQDLSHPARDNFIEFILNEEK